MLGAGSDNPLQRSSYSIILNHISMINMIFRIHVYSRKFALSTTSGALQIWFDHKQQWFIKPAQNKKVFPKFNQKQQWFINNTLHFLLSGKSTYCVVAMAHKSTSHCWHRFLTHVKINGTVKRESPMIEETKRMQYGIGWLNGSRWA